MARRTESRKRAEENRKHRREISIELYGETRPGWRARAGRRTRKLFDRRPKLVLGDALRGRGGGIHGGTYLRAIAMGRTANMEIAFVFVVNAAFADRRCLIARDHVHPRPGGREDRR